MNQIAQSEKKYTRRLIQLAALLYLLLLAGPASAQDLHLYYDLFTDSISYQKEGKVVEKPKIRKGDYVLVHFTEFNPYIYQAKAEVEQSNAENWSGSSSSGTLGLAPGVGGPMSILSPGAAGAQAPMSFLDIPLLSMGQNSLSLGDLFGGSRGTEQLFVQARVQLQALAETQAQMAKIYEEIQTLEKSERAAQLAAQHLDQLLLSPRIRPSLIQKIAAEYLNLIFPDKPSATALQLDDAFQWEQRPARKRRLLQDLQAKQRKYDGQMIKLAPITQQISSLDIGSTELETFAGELRNITEESGSLRQQLEAYIASQSEKTTQDLSVEEMMTLQLKFRELADQSFTYDVAISVEKSTVIATAEFTPLDSVITVGRISQLSTKIKTVKLVTKGGLQISTGFGVAFGRMFDPAQEFSAKENKIVADAGGLVSPSLTTFLHFYPNNQSGLALAGTFGIGIPLSNSNLSALNFYLGPSLLLGRGQRIVLSCGITAGPTQRLGKGFKVGDDFDPNAGDIPVRSQYELGYFVGISFNMGG